MNKTKHVILPKKLKILRFVAAIILLLIAFVTYTLSATSIPKQYERAKQLCDSELWLVERDAVFYDIKRIQQPYPKVVNELSGEEIVDFACNQREAESKQQNAKSTGTIAYFLALSIFIWGPLIPIILIWWAIEELRHWRKT